MSNHLLTVVDNPGLVRDTNTKAVLCRDLNAKEKFMRERHKKIFERNLQDEVKNLKILVDDLLKRVQELEKK
jgi:hypothetical protein